MFVIWYIVQYTYQNVAQRINAIIWRLRKATPCWQTYSIDLYSKNILRTFSASKRQNIKNIEPESEKQYSCKKARNLLSTFGWMNLIDWCYISETTSKIILEIYIEDGRSDLNYSSANVNVFTESRINHWISLKQTWGMNLVTTNCLEMMQYLLMWDHMPDMEVQKSIVVLIVL